MHQGKRSRPPCLDAPQDRPSSTAAAAPHRRHLRPDPRADRDAWAQLGIYDIENPVTFSAYAALAVAVTAVMLSSSAHSRPTRRPDRTGTRLVVRPARDQHRGCRDRRHRRATASSVRPSSPAALADSYRISNGSILIDLSRMRDLPELDGRDLAVSLNAGEILLRPVVNVDVDADIRYAGEISAGDITREGSTTRSTQRCPRPPGPERRPSTWTSTPGSARSPSKKSRSPHRPSSKEPSHQGARQCQISTSSPPIEASRSPISSSACSSSEWPSSGPSWSVT